MITTEYGKQNIFPQETQPIVMTNNSKAVSLMNDAEELNGRLAMIGFVAAIGSYIITGQIIPGIF
ncbi:high light inducible protein [Candidatus Poribacteria bacterium]|nr:high light inducible protein [Candidatus Poribacteria bacterium]|tara:strand:+ start:2888 stop:3082 length:195 start_codon:yes stop_codon:yes gene_type:complete